MSDPAWFADEQAQGARRGEPGLAAPVGHHADGDGAGAQAHSFSSGVRYRWRLFRGRRDRLSDVQHAVEAGRPVAMLIGRFIPRHWVLIVDTTGSSGSATNRRRGRCARWRWLRCGGRG